LEHKFGEKRGGSDANAYLAEMIRRYGGLVRHICRNALGDRPEDVDECVSDAFTALWEKAESGGYDPGAGEVKHYLCGIARNKAIDRYRKLAARPATVPISDAEAGGAAETSALSAPDIAELIEREDEASLIADAVDGLPSPDREVFILRYCYLERVKAIAEKLGMSEKAVENRLYRGKLALGHKLSREDIRGDKADAERPKDESSRDENLRDDKVRNENLRDGTLKKDYEVIIYG
jgi:RNA polymerase sigma-70 factor (ECF subfamily)